MHPQAIEQQTLTVCCFFINRANFGGIRTRRKKTVRRTVFADAATSVSEATGADSAGTKSLQARQPKKSLDVNRVAFLFVLFNFIKTNF